MVLKTSPGHANSVAVALDNEEWPEVVGTIAGDDTILVITPDTPTAESVQEKLLALLGKTGLPACLLPQLDRSDVPELMIEN